MGQLQQKFIEEYGPEQGRKLFKERFADPMAATTAGADPKANLMMVGLANFLKTMDKRFPTAAYDVPYPAGSRYVMANLKQFQKMIMEGRGVTPANPKRYDYSNGFLGHTAGPRRAVLGDNGGPRMEGVDYDSGPPVDEQRFRLMDPDRSAPPRGTYGTYKSALVDRADAHGVDPTYYGDMVYAGAGKSHRIKPMIVYFNEMIERTHRMTGMARDQVLRGFIRGEIPIFGIGGILAAKQLSADDDED
jgi:hypothetical protein